MFKSLMRIAKRKEGAAHDPRRKEYRYEVDLPAEIVIDGTSYDCIIADLSPSGALVTVDAPLASGAKIEINLPKLGQLPAQVMHAGAGFCGVQFINPEKYRDQISSWLASHSA